MKNLISKIKNRTKKGVIRQAHREINKIMCEINYQAWLGKNYYCYRKCSDCIEQEEFVIEYFKQNGFEVDVDRERFGVYQVIFEVTIKW